MSNPNIYISICYEHRRKHMCKCIANDAKYIRTRCLNLTHFPNEINTESLSQFHFSLLLALKYTIYRMHSAVHTLISLCVRFLLPNKNIYIYMRVYRFIFIYKNCSKFYWRARLHTIHLNANILWRTPRSSFNCIFILYGVLQFQSSGFCVYIRVQRTTEWTCMSIHNNGWSNLNMFWKSLFSICLISPFVTHFYWIKNTFVSGICTTVCIINNPATFRCFFFHGCFFAVAK